MGKNTIKYSCIFTLLLLIFYAFIPVISINEDFLTIKAKELNENDIYKGLGLAFLFILISKIGQSRSTTPIDTDYIRDNIDSDFSNEDIHLLARIIHGEARGEPYDGQVAVGAVVLNRVKSADFPNTIREVIYQKNQFSAVDDGQINLIPNNSAYQAAEEALKGIDPSRGALFFYNPKTAKTIRWLSQRETTIIIGNHVFAK